MHPNFLPGSTQGDTARAVLDHCLAIVPEASTMRTHGLFQSSALLALLAGDKSITQASSGPVLQFLTRVAQLAANTRDDAELARALGALRRPGEGEIAQWRLAVREPQ